MKLLSLFIVFGCLFAQSQGIGIMQDIVLWIDRTICQILTQVDDSLVQKVRGGNFTIQDEKLKNYSFCVYRILGILNSNGNVNTWVGLRKIPSKTSEIRFLAAVFACSGVTGVNVVDKAWNGLVCYNQQYPGDIFAL